MNNLYKSAMNKVALSELKSEEILDRLSETTEHKANYKHHRELQTAVIAAAFVIAIFAIPSTRAGIASAATYLKQAFQLLDGTKVTVTKTVDTTEASIVIDENSFNLDKYVKIENDRIFFILNNTKIDVTDQCSNTSSFRYDVVDDNGRNHIIFVGGNVDTVGWAEFVFDADGTYLTNMMHVPVVEKWLYNAEISIDVPTGNPEIDFRE